MPHFDNQLLAMLAPQDLERLRPDLVVTDLTFGTVLAEPKQLIDRIYFPHSGIVSFVVPLSDGPAIETGMVGRDGVVGAGEVLDGKLAVNRVVVQIAGKASAIGIRARHLYESQIGLITQRRGLQVVPRL